MAMTTFYRFCSLRESKPLNNIACERKDFCKASTVIERDRDVHQNLRSYLNSDLRLFASSACKKLAQVGNELYSFKSYRKFNVEITVFIEKSASIKLVSQVVNPGE